MQFVNQIIQQVRELLQTMTPASKMIAGMLLLCIIVSSAFLVRGSSTKATEYLFGGRDLTESELDAAENAFGISGLHAYERVGRRIRVPLNERSAYLKALAENNAFPRQLGSNIEAALSATSFLESLEVGKRRYQAVREQDIANAIKNFPFVEDAYLTHDELDQGFSSKKLQVASIFVQPKMGKSLTEQQKRSIMQLVANSFAGLQYENISIGDLSNGAAMSGALDPMSAEEQKYYFTKTQQENELKSKVANLLSDYGDVRIEVYVDLDPTLREASQLVKYGEKPTTLETNEMKKESESAKPVEGGRPGANPNAITNRSQSLEQYAQSSSKQKESTITERKVTGQETTVVDKVGLIPKRASISVAIPRSYYKRAFYRQWLDQNPDKTQADLASIDKTVFVQGTTAIKDEVDKNIQRTLANIIPPEQPGGDRFPLITVTDYLDEPVVAPPGPSLVELALAYVLGSWQMLGMFGLAGIALLFLRSVSRSGPTGNTDAEFERGFNIQLEDPATWDLSALGPEALNDAASIDANSPESSEKGGRKFNLSGGEIKEELTTLVRDNPDAAASLLRSWIGDS